MQVIKKWHSTRPIINVDYGRAEANCRRRIQKIWFDIKRKVHIRTTISLIYCELSNSSPFRCLDSKSLGVNKHIVNVLRITNYFYPPVSNTASNSCRRRSKFFNLLQFFCWPANQQWKPSRTFTIRINRYIPTARLSAVPSCLFIVFFDPSCIDFKIALLSGVQKSST